MNTDRSDEQLVVATLSGDDAAAGQLFDRYWSIAWRTAYGIVGRRAAADDVAQDAMAQAFVGLERFDRSRPFGPWLRRIVANRALNEVRAARRSTGLADEVPDRVDWVGQTLDRAELVAALADLPPERRDVVVMRYWLDQTPTEIADALELPAGTIHSRLARGLEQLRQHLEVGSVDHRS